MTSAGEGAVELSGSAGESRLALSGDWTIAHYGALAPRVAALRSQVEPGTRIEVAALGALDTAGVALLHDLLGATHLAHLAGDASLLGAERRALLKAVADALASEPAAPARRGYALGDVLEHVGRTTWCSGAMSWISPALSASRWRPLWLCCCCRDAGA